MLHQPSILPKSVAYISGSNMLPDAVGNCLWEQLLVLLPLQAGGLLPLADHWLMVLRCGT